MDNMVNNMPQNDKTADATCVFRVPSGDVTVPDLMANVRITAPVLSIVKGPQTGAAFELEDDVTTIGRDPANGIFLNDMTVSRSHARIIREGLGARIEDLGSLNGTWVGRCHRQCSPAARRFFRPDRYVYAHLPREHAGAHRNR